jgi:hypothetical protein
MATTSTMPKIKNAPEVNNRILQELIAEILREGKPQVPFPHWYNWRNMR